MAKKVGGGGAIMQPYDENGEYDFNEEGVEPERVVKGKPPSDKSIDELKKEISQNEKPTENTIVNAQREVDKKTITDSNAFKTIISGRDKIEKDLERLSDEQLGIVSKYIDKLKKFTDGSGLCGWNGEFVKFNQKSSGNDLDKDLGFGWDATTFYHEYGHFVDNMESIDGGGNIYSNSSKDVNVDDDALYAFNEIVKEGGINTPIKNLKRIPVEYHRAFMKGLSKISGKDDLWKRKSEREFGYKPKPQKPYLTPEEARLKLGEYGYKRTVESWKEYKEKQDLYLKAEADGTNAEALKKFKQYNEVDLPNHNKPYMVQEKRYGIVSDFFGMYTNNRINPYGQGFWAHRPSYNKTQSPQIETWAEYFSFKMTNDTKGLDIMKKYFPKTYKAFEEKYNKLGGKTNAK